MARHLTRLGRGAASPSPAEGGPGEQLPSGVPPEPPADVPAPGPAGRAPAEQAPVVATQPAEPDLAAAVAAYGKQYWPEDDSPEHDVGAVLRIVPFRRLWIALIG